MKRMIIVVVLSLALAWAADRAREQKFQQAVDLMETRGDLPAALKLFEELAKGPDRNLAARSLLYLGSCYEKLGKEGSQHAYERIVREFADQRDVTLEARSRLAAMRPAAGGGIRTRQVWKDPDGGLDGGVSGDGRYLSFTDWDTGDLAVRDLRTGENRRLTNKGSWSDSSDYAETSAISHDGAMVACAWFSAKAKGYELRVIPAKGGEPRVIDKDPSWMRLHAWTPDDQHVIVEHDGEHAQRFDLVAVKDGSARTLMTVDRALWLLRVSPDGKWLAYNRATTRAMTDFDIHVRALDGSQDGLVVVHPDDDRLLDWTPDGAGLAFTSNRSGVPSVWLQPVRNSKPAGSPQPLPVTVGAVSPLGITRSGALYYGVRTGMQDVYLADWDAAAGKLAGPPIKATEQYVGSNLTPAWTRDGRLIFYSTRGMRPFPGGASAVMIRTADGSAREVRLNRFTPPFIRMALFPDGRSGVVPTPWQEGFYRVDLETGKEEFLFPNANAGFETAVSPDGGSVYYSKDNAVVRRELATGRETELRVPGNEGRGMSLSPDGRHLAILAGEIGKGGVLSLLSLETGQLRVLCEHVGGRRSGVAWEAEGRHLLFVRSSSGKPELMRISAEGGEPQPVGFQMEGLRMPAISPDGKKIAFQAGVSRSEVWVLENLPAQRR